MKKLIRISMIATLVACSLFLVAGLTRVVAIYPRTEDLPPPFTAFSVILIAYWMVIGIVSLIMYFKPVVKFLKEFINE